MKIVNYVNCKICGHSVANTVLKKHENSCDGSGVKYKNLIENRLKFKNEDGLVKCEFCNKLVKPLGLSAHIRFSHKGCKLDFSNRIPWNKGLTKTDERVNKLAQSISKTMSNIPGRAWTEQQKQAQSDLKKKLYIEFPEKHPNRKLANNRNKMSYPERVCYDWLVKNNIEFKHQFKFDSWYIDFKIKTTLIEIDGSYWHNPKIDEIRDSILEKHGFKVIRILANSNIENELEKIFNAGFT